MRVQEPNSVSCLILSEGLPVSSSLDRKRLSFPWNVWQVEKRKKRSSGKKKREEKNPDDRVREKVLALAALHRCEETPVKRSSSVFGCWQREIKPGRQCPGRCREIERTTVGLIKRRPQWLERETDTEASSSSLFCRRYSSFRLMVIFSRVTHFPENMG